MGFCLLYPAAQSHSGGEEFVSNPAPPTHTGKDGADNTKNRMSAGVFHLAENPEARTALIRALLGTQCGKGRTGHAVGNSVNLPQTEE